MMTLQDWRLNWTAEELEWRTGWEARRDHRREERELRKREARARDRVYFGAGTWGVSKDQRAARADEARLRLLNLPALADEKALAAWLGISLGKLRWYTHDKPADRVWHYVRFTREKKSGGQRVILAPKRELKALQRKILRELLERVSTSPRAHGFIRERSIVTNAGPHIGRAVVANLDLKDFFPSITFPRVRGLFIRLGYSFSVATALALLCTEYDREPVERGDKTYYVAVGARHLVQGAPTSPALANIMARRLDARLNGLAARKGFVYTRYADDLTFSGDDASAARKLLRAAERIITAEGFCVHPDKTRVYRRSSRQMVTGVVVNDKPAAPRELRRRVRAILHQARTTGLNAQNHDGRPNFRAYLSGQIAYIHQTDPMLAQRMMAELRALAD